jgi:hypothetical protein
MSIGRPDAAAGGADLAVAAGRFAQPVEVAVQRQDERGVLGDQQVAGGDRDALGLEPVDLLQQGPGVDDDAVADDRQLAWPDDARGQQAELEGAVADDQGVPGIVAALEAHDDVGPLAEPVDDLALALVPPLGADHRDISHELGPPVNADERR